MPALACLMLTAHDDTRALFAAVMAGAAGYVLNQIRAAGLIGAVRLAAAGQPLPGPDAAATMMARIREARHPDPPTVPADSEHRILELTGEGLTNRQIAEHTHLAEETVKDRAAAPCTRLDAERRTQPAAHGRPARPLTAAQRRSRAAPRP
jgi:DNA-binding NarL/FixJ family response regulator